MRFITHAPMQTTDLGGYGGLFFLNMYDPLNNIHEQFEFLNHCDGCIVAYITDLMPSQCCNNNICDVTVEHLLG